MAKSTDEYRVMKQSVNEKIGVIEWYVIINCKSQLEIARSKSCNSAHFICTLLNDDYNKNHGT